jgi:hypothetical protein
MKKNIKTIPAIGWCETKSVLFVKMESNIKRRNAMKPENKKVEPVVSKSEEKRLVIQKAPALKQVCQNCEAYDRKTKQCKGCGGKYVPRKGTCEAFSAVVK